MFVAASLTGFAAALLAQIEPMEDASAGRLASASQADTKVDVQRKTIDFFGCKSGEATPSNEELSEGECAKCNETVCMAYKTSCKHLYCYYCLQCLVAESQNSSCLVCGETITSAIRA